jgi:hypothetical protein
MTGALATVEREPTMISFDLACGNLHGSDHILFNSQAGDLLKDRRRINVCLTRAKSKLWRRRLDRASEGFCGKLVDPVSLMHDVEELLHDGDAGNGRTGTRRQSRPHRNLRGEEVALSR